MGDINFLAYRTSITLAAFLAMPALTAEVDTSDWVCEFCPFESGQRANYEAGAGYVSDDAARFGNASGYDEKGAFASVDGDGSFTGDNHQARWTIEDLGLDSRVAEIEGGRQGTYDYYLSWREIPQRVFDTTNTIFVQVSADTLAVPSSWVSAPLTSGFTELDSSLVSRNIESDRQTLRLGGRYLFGNRFRVSADFRRQKRDGNSVFGGSFFTQSSLLPGAIDYETDEIDVGVRYAGENGFISLAYYASLFENNNAALRWDNPFTWTPGAIPAAQAQAPDNDFHQFSLSGSYRFAPLNTVLAFSGALGTIEQDDALLPYTTNASILTTPLPQSSLNGEVETSNYAVSLASRPHRRARINFAYRYDARDNQSPQLMWNRVITDSFNSGEIEANVPYSFERSKLNLSGHYDLFKTVRISGGYDRTTLDRDFQEVAEQTEDSGWGRVRWRPSGYVTVEVKSGASERDVDRYDESFASGLGQNPLMRKYNLAYRYRQFGELTFAASLAERPVSFTLNALFADDDYRQSQLGLLEGEDLRLAADVSWSFSDNAFVYLNAGYENIESLQTGSEQFSTPDWRATNADDFVTAGVGLRVDHIADKFDLQVDYIRSEGTSEINIDSASRGSSRFPDLESTLDSLRVSLAYRLSERLELAFRLRYEKFKAEDWGLQGVGPATMPVVLTLGANPYDYDVFMIGVGFRYMIGDIGASAVASDD